MLSVPVFHITQTVFGVWLPCSFSVSLCLVMSEGATTALKWVRTNELYNPPGAKGQNRHQCDRGEGWVTHDEDVSTEKCPGCNHSKTVRYRGQGRDHIWSPFELKVWKRCLILQRSYCFTASDHCNLCNWISKETRNVQIKQSGRKWPIMCFNCTVYDLLSRN